MTTTKAALDRVIAKAREIAQCKYYEDEPPRNWRDHDAHSDAHDACHAALDILDALENDNV